ncbi:aspartate-semialdehyde dehydrogenase [Streptomyces sp. NPDC056254]|uniref:aspartate-semialdehyde dehydrogenase n=1 Tax=unclassified Streptomyces TaxID=2593676 RepID=UPI0004AB250F|nr:MULTISPECIES: aspartate-semialdehyde dehydrogenase [unclassified Streptomyces]APU41153.1 aspartate-semialdehyde dehydrogenase [Streptomyces sp. TN58]KJK54210.1 aspartate-semialdehyde dehydrogenase [Streptomyces sp. NRRL F-4428]
MTAPRSTPAPALAVVGATGAVGAVLLRMLSQRADVWGDIRLIASARSAGRMLSVRGQECEVLALTEDAFDGLGPGDVAVLLTPAEVSARWAPVVTARGAVVVDQSAAFRDDPEVPLVVPEINAHAARIRPRGIVAAPDTVTAAMAASLGALHAEYGLIELAVSTYQAASAAGRAGSEALRRQLSLVAGTVLGEQPGDVRRAVGEDTGPFAAPLALNVVPWCGELDEDGWSSHELAVRTQTRRILQLEALPVSVTCVRVPVLTGDSLTVRAGFRNEVKAARAREILEAAPGVVLVDDPAAGEFPTPVDAAGTDPAWVGRVRASLDDPCALEFFVCADNLRQGAALNATRIAELIAGEFA